MANKIITWKYAIDNFSPYLKAPLTGSIELNKCLTKNALTSNYNIGANDLSGYSTNQLIPSISINFDTYGYTHSNVTTTVRDIYEDSNGYVIHVNDAGHGGISGYKVSRTTFTGAMAITGFTLTYNSWVRSICDTKDGYLVFVGDFSDSGRQRIAKIRISDGQLMNASNSSFNTSTGPNIAIYDVVFNDKNHLYIGGEFTQYKGESVTRITKINKDTAIRDTSFKVGINDNRVNCLEYSNNMIYAGGTFVNISDTTISSLTVNRFFRANDVTGLIDRTFSSTLGTAFNSDVCVIKILPNGKILVGGAFTTFKGVSQNRLIMLNSDGTKDTSFNIGTGFDNTVWAIEFDPNMNRIYVGGNFGVYKGESSNNKIIRLNLDGTKDTSFNTGTGFNREVYTIRLSFKQQIYVGGTFTNYKSAGVKHIIRLKRNGDLDTGGQDIYIDPNPQLRV